MKTKAELKKDAIGGLNKQLLRMDFPLLDKATLFGRETAIARAPFPFEENVNMKEKMKMLPQMGPTLLSVIKSIKLAKKQTVQTTEKSISKEQFDTMIHLFKDCGIDQIGYAKIEEWDVFKDLGVPYKHVLVLTSHQNKEKILTSPSMTSQIEVGRLYGVTGKAANVISSYLINQGFSAFPGHSLGGSVDYSKLGEMANLGEIGRHGLLIEPVSGPNHRIGVIYTNINNLNELFKNNMDHSWVKEFCETCGNCIRKCSGQAIKEVPSIDDNGHITSIEYIKCHPEFGCKWGCNVCVAVCPFTTVGYDKLKNKRK